MNEIGQPPFSRIADEGHQRFSVCAVIGLIVDKFADFDV